MDEIVLVKDGVLSCELNTIIDNYVKKYPNLIKVVTLEKNVCLKYLINYDILLTNSEIIDYNGKSLNENLFKKNPLQSNFFSILYKTASFNAKSGVLYFDNAKLFLHCFLRFVPYLSSFSKVDQQALKRAELFAFVLGSNEIPLKLNLLDFVVF